MFKKFFKILWIGLFNIILFLYLAEFYVTLFMPSLVNPYNDLDHLRYMKAKDSGVNYDKRTYYQTFFEEKNKGKKLSPRFQFTSAYWSPKIYGEGNPIQEFLRLKIENKNIIPLKGPINRKTLSCNETGSRKIINNDKYGFKNSHSVYEKKIRIMLLGSSFVHGSCHDENYDIAGSLRNELKINAANYGISGGGPLLSLAALKEYGPEIKPEYVVYFYTEGSDMQGLKNEKETFLLKYLNDFKQDLAENNDKAQEFLDEYEKIAYKFFENKFGSQPSKYEEKVDMNKNNKVEMVKDFFELQKLKNIFSTKTFYFNNDNTIEEDLFLKVLNKMTLVSNQWNGNLVLVYLPDWNRFNSKYSLVGYFHKKKIEKILKKTNVIYIDMVKEFEKSQNPINYYPFGIRGHYTKDGYRLIADTIFEMVNK